MKQFLYLFVFFSSEKDFHVVAQTPYSSGFCDYFPISWCGNSISVKLPGRIILNKIKLLFSLLRWAQDPKYKTYSEIQTHYQWFACLARLTLHLARFSLDEVKLICNLKLFYTISVNSSTNSYLKPKTLIRKLERVLIKLYRQSVYLLFNQTCLNEELLPNHTHTHTHTLYIYIRLNSTDTFIECDQMKLLFLHSSHNYSKCCSTWIPLVKKLPTVDMASSCELFSQWTFSPMNFSRPSYNIAL